MSPVLPLKLFSSCILQMQKTLWGTAQTSLGSGEGRWAHLLAVVWNLCQTGTCSSRKRFWQFPHGKKKILKTISIRNYLQYPIANMLHLSCKRPGRCSPKEKRDGVEGTLADLTKCVSPWSASAWTYVKSQSWWQSLKLGKKNHQKLQKMTMSLEQQFLPLPAAGLSPGLRGKPGDNTEHSQSCLHKPQFLLLQGCPQQAVWGTLYL